MRQTILLILSCSLTVLLSSCNTVKTYLERVVALGNGDSEVELTSIFSRYSIFPLHEDSLIYIGDVDKIKHSGENILISDTQSQYIASYNHKGELQNVFYHLGRGKEEYIRILDFDVDKENIYVLTYPYKLYKLDNNMDIISVTNLDEDFVRIASFRDTQFLYSDQRSQLCSLGKNGEIKILHKGRPLKSCPKLNLPVFHRTDGKLLYAPDGSDIVFQIEGEEINPWLQVDYEQKEKVLERYSQDRILQVTERQKFSYPAIKSIMELNSRFLILYTYKHVYRIAIIDSSNMEIITDGDAIGTPLPKVQSDGRILSATFCDEDSRILGNTVSKEELNFMGIPSDGGIVIVEYKE